MSDFTFVLLQAGILALSFWNDRRKSIRRSMYFAGLVGGMKPKRWESAKAFENRVTAALIKARNEDYRALGWPTIEEEP